jgi:2-haloalkanoic acid dehalogenase type II
MSADPKPKLLIFDLLTALLDSWTTWDKAASTALSEFSGSSSDISHAAAPPNSLGRAWRQNYLRLTYQTGPYVPYADLVRSAASLTPGLPSTAPNILLANYTKWIKPWPEVPEVLKALRSQGYKLAVATNCSAELGHTAAALCSDELGEGIFDVVVTAEESGWYKPAPEAYLAVLSRINVRPQEVLFVAGSASDVPGACRAGFRVVWHNRIGMVANSKVKPEKEGKTLREALADIL